MKGYKYEEEKPFFNMAKAPGFLSMPNTPFTMEGPHFHSKLNIISNSLEDPNIIEDKMPFKIPQLDY